jgi:hypothetical protein
MNHNMIGMVLLNPFDLEIIGHSRWLKVSFKMNVNCNAKIGALLLFCGLKAQLMPIVKK